MSDAIWRRYSDTSPVIRTDFAHDDEWLRVRAAIVEPQTEAGFTAKVVFVDDRAYDGLTASRLLEIAPAGSRRKLAFLVDTLTLTHPERPILVVNAYDWVEDLEDSEADGKGPRFGATFRVIPSLMWGVENNLSLANMDWEDFADSVDDDGIFRGFNRMSPGAST